MYIRRTMIKSRKTGEPYYTYRLVESVRTGSGVRQHTLLNLGTNFPYPREKWPEMAGRIEDIIHGQRAVFELPHDLETACQSYAALLIQAQHRAEQEVDSTPSDYRNVDINTLKLMRPRSVAIEHVGYQSLRRLRLDEKMRAVGFNKHQLNAAIGAVIGRMAEPGSELATHYWLQHQSGLGELIGYDFEKMSLDRIYHASDVLLKHKDELEQHLFEHQRNYFQLTETITLYDLTNTYFEGSCKYNDWAAFGKSKERRSDCPLVTLGLVLDGSGFPKRSKVFKGNVAEAKTLAQMIRHLQRQPENGDRKGLFETLRPIVVMDAGIATEANIHWLKDHHYRYLVVSRRRHREFSEEEAVAVKIDRDCTVKVHKRINAETGEIELYCHSTAREKKEKAIANRFMTRFEEALRKLDAGLHKKGCLKKYDKVLESIGRLKRRYSKAQRHYRVTVEKDDLSGNATQINWECKLAQPFAESYPGVYCLRTNEKDLDETQLWHTYTMLTDLEAVFRSLKSELGLRPVFHQKTRRVSGHLFISLLAYHLVHTIRYQLRRKGIDASWSDLRKQLKGQDRVTTSMRCSNGETVHVRKSTWPEPRQQRIYDALGLSHLPGRIVKRSK